MAARSPEHEGEALIVFARTPALGKVKTRLQPDLTPREALELHRAMVVDAASLGRADGRRRGAHVEVCFSEGMAKDEEIDRELAGLELTRQHGDDFGERLVHAFQDRLHQGARRVVIIGSDSPTMAPDYLDAAFSALESHDVVIGPADDGGYVLVGCSILRIRPFQGIPWGTAQVLEHTRKKLRKLRISHHLLRPLHDLDTREDLVRTYDELVHLEQLNACHAPWTLEVLRDLMGRHPEWQLH